MGQMIIAGLAIQDITQAFAGGEPAAGVYYALPPYGEAPMEDAPEYEDVQLSWPGVDGSGIKRLGFRGRNIHATIVILGDSKAACEAIKDSLFTSWTPLARFSITIPGGSARPGCRLLAGGATFESWSNLGRLGTTMLAGVLKASFRQLSLS